MIKSTMLISKYPLLAQDKVLRKEEGKKLTGMDGWGFFVAFAKSANWVWTSNFEPTHTILWTGQKGTTPPPQLFQKMGIIRLSFSLFSFVLKALGEPALTLVPWPKKKN